MVLKLHRRQLVTAYRFPSDRMETKSAPNTLTSRLLKLAYNKLLQDYTNLKSTICCLKNDG